MGEKRSNPKQLKNLSQKDAPHFSNQDSTRQPKVLVKTFGWQMSNRTVRKKIVRKGQYWVYIVQCKDGTYYTGYTNNLEERIERHSKGFASKYTSHRRPVKLVWYKKYKYYKRAFLEEIRIKSLTRKQKEHLVTNGK